jgi:hypothetical protein
MQEEKARAATTTGASADHDSATHAANDCAGDISEHNRDSAFIARSL